jgi:lipoyl(octanoyl) transferase
VTTALDYFGLIVPCGIADRGVTSLQKILDRSVSVSDVSVAATAAFAGVFDREPRTVPLEPAQAPVDSRR